MPVGPDPFRTLPVSKQKPSGPFMQPHSLVHRAGSVPAVRGDCPDTQALSVSVGEATEDCHKSLPAGGEGPSAAAPVRGVQTPGPCQPPRLQLGQTTGCGSPEVLRRHKPGPCHVQGQQEGSKEAPPPQLKDISDLSMTPPQPGPFFLPNQGHVAVTADSFVVALTQAPWPHHSCGA